MKRLLLTLLSAISLSACAQTSPPTTAAKPTQPAKAELPAAIAAAGTPEARARAAILAVNPQVQIDQVSASPLPGFQQVIVNGEVIYVSDDGKYLMQGSLYDVAAKKNLGEAVMAQLRTKLLTSIPASDRIVFAPAHPKYTVTVFTDVECAYCRKLHSEIADYNQQGIAVEYVAFPRMGLGSEDFRKMVAVWCSPDRKAALTDAKNDRPVPYRNCNNPVTMQYKLGQRMGLTGTPMILTSDGIQVGGYVPPAQLRQVLDKMAADGATPVASTATGSR
ncbi:DsbC family protein [Cognatiluteimonas profundi]|uniref:DsbC family protein n=1 Tax=Cognatiluteimonas profundi TaxID=2594501 RepID=UPI00131BB7FA|nr:DsbC family protein [Lysobacter profundi]